MAEEIEKAQWAFERVAQKLRKENARLGLPSLATFQSPVTPTKPYLGLR
jgi:hypothetical protein